MAISQVLMQDAVEAVGNGTAINFLEPGYGAAEKVVLQVSGTFTATVTYEATVNGATWVAWAATDDSTTSTAAEVLVFETAGLSQFRARVSAYTDGEVTVQANVFTGD